MKLRWNLPHWIKSLFRRTAAAPARPRLSPLGKLQALLGRWDASRWFRSLLAPASPASNRRPSGFAWRARSRWRSAGSPPP